jgi:hypothetical protein
MEIKMSTIEGVQWDRERTRREIGRAEIFEMLRQGCIERMERDGVKGR